MSYTLFITEAAENHVDEAYQYYEMQQEGLGKRFLTEVNATYKKQQSPPNTIAIFLHLTTLGIYAYINSLLWSYTKSKMRL